MRPEKPNPLIHHATMQHPESPKTISCCPSGPASQGDGEQRSRAEERRSLGAEQANRRKQDLDSDEDENEDERTKDQGPRSWGNPECGQHTLVTWPLVLSTMHLSRGVPKKGGGG
ncbi:uncharacterized protein Dyak_GE17065 [Drosophila yakuba]|uniref:Uncharacterized protein n=1 Tax=Drosophila yakuba TaxID=7245 RepID=B4Q2A4_DROYA|nr:uncharacterized protein Dyak_GE17065 [Drosophila yakuba]